MKTSIFSDYVFSSKRRNASATLVALLIVFVASFVLAGWAMILAARVQSSEQASEGQKRRIAIQNAKNIGLQWARHGLSTDSVTNMSLLLPNDWGQFIAVNTTSGMLGTTNTPTNFINHFGPMGIGGYVQQFSVSLVASNFSGSNWMFFRSRSPFLGGYPLVGQTNTSIATSSFRRLLISTNLGSGVLMYASNSSSDAAAGAFYNSQFPRTVIAGIGSTTLVGPTAYPLIPMISAASGTNAYSGQLTAAPPRASIINLPSVFASTNNNAYGSNVPNVNDSIGDFRIIGAPSTYADTSTFQLIPRNESTNRFLIINTISGSTASSSTLSFSGNTYSISMTNSSWLSVRRGTTTNIANLSGTNQYIYLKPSTSLNPVLFTNKPPRITARDAAGGSLIVMPVTSSELLALQGNYVTFRWPTNAGPAQADSPDVVNGAVVYLENAYGVSGGVGFVLLGANRAGAARNAMALFTPTNQIYIRALVNNLPLVQIFPATNYTIQSAANVDSINFRLTDTYRLRLRGSTNATPLLLHMDQQYVRDQSGTTIVGNPHWRRVLMVMNQTSSININTNISALTFSYLDDGTFDMGTDNANSTRPIFLSVEGQATANTGVNFQAPHNRTWQLGMTLRNANATFFESTNVPTIWTIRGGLRSNSRLEVSGNNLSLTLTATNSGFLEQISDRMGWIESWQQ